MPQILSYHELLAVLEQLAFQADEDCPSELRTEHFRDALHDAFAAIAAAREVPS